MENIHDPILRIENVTLAFGGLKAVNSVDMTLEKGEIRGLIGPNGSGKSSLINLISGVYKPTSGKIFFRNEDISKSPPHKIASLGICRTFQTIRLFPRLSVLDNVLAGGHTKSSANVFEVMFRTKSMKSEEKWLNNRAYEMINLVGLSGLEGEKVRNLPQGQQKLLEIARVLMAEPSLILLDEPTAGLSPQETDEVSKIIQLLKEQGLSVILVEHKMKFVLGLSDSVTVLNTGLKIAEGTPKEIQEKDEVVRAYLGSEMTDAKA
ncbi:MAG: ABC transporter ATP-binding protein [Chloroflexi bacterium]|nr:ABC transporter ATP-binding protein [Chloroflexota bacterium]